MDLQFSANPCKLRGEVTLANSKAIPNFSFTTLFSNSLPEGDPILSTFYSMWRVSKSAKSAKPKFVAYKLYSLHINLKGYELPKT